MPDTPRVGVGVILRRPDGAFLVGERKGSHGAGQLALPGGALELYETVRQCATRETLEEVGMRVPEDAWRAPFTVAEAVIDANNHWITIFALAHVMQVAMVGNAGGDLVLVLHNTFEWHNDVLVKLGPTFSF